MGAKKVGICAEGDSDGAAGAAGDDSDDGDGDAGVKQVLCASAKG